MNTQAEVTLKSFIMAAIVMSAMVFVGTSMIADVVSENPDMQMGDDSTQFNRTFNKYQDLKTEAEGMEGGIKNSSIEDKSIFGPVASLIQGTWANVKGVFTSVTLVKDMFVGDGDKGGLASSNIEFPWWIGMIIGTLITALVSFLLISAFWRWKL